MYLKVFKGSSLDFNGIKEGDIICKFDNLLT